MFIGYIRYYFCTYRFKPWAENAGISISKIIVLIFFSPAKFSFNVAVTVLLFYVRQAPKIHLISGLQKIHFNRFHVDFTG